MENITVAWDGAEGFDLLDAAYERLTPKELLLLSLGKCAALTARALFVKMQLHITAFEVETAGQLSGPPTLGNTVFTSFTQHFRIGCPDPADHPKVLHALQLTHDKYCGVGQMLALVAPITHTITINGIPHQD